MAFQLDRLSCQTADIVVVDTFAHAKYFEQTFGIPRSRIHVLYAGCDDHLFKPVKVSPPDEPIVLFYGSYLPLHGVDIILRAAGQMTDERVRFVLIGRGQEYRTTRALALELELSNAKFANPVPLESLPGIIAQSTICLGGHFGHSEKASRVIAGKTFQCLAVEKPTIVGDNPANRELFTHGKDVWMCPMADPTALANAIRHLLDSPQLRTQLGKSGREVILRSCGNAATSQAIHTIIEAAVATHQSGSPRTAS
jgi:glycosyltransferase involved in cell wall biosynthesis